MTEIQRRERRWFFPKARINEAEYIEFLALLHALETTCSRFIRKAIREAIGQGPDLLMNDMRLFREALNQVAALGRNVNQLVKAYHAGQPPAFQVDQATIEAFEKQVNQLKEELSTVILKSKNRWVKRG